MLSSGRQWQSEILRENLKTKETGNCVGKKKILVRWQPLHWEDSWLRNSREIIESTGIITRGPVSTETQNQSHSKLDLQLTTRDQCQGQHLRVSEIETSFHAIVFSGMTVLLWIRMKMATILRHLLISQQLRIRTRRILKSLRKFAASEHTVCNPLAVVL